MRNGNDRDLPWIKTYTRERLADPNLRLCSESALGIFHLVELAAWMAEEAGILARNGKAMTTAAIATVIARDPARTEAAIQELLEHGALERRDEDGALVIPDMAHKAADARALSEVRAAAGRKGMESRWGKQGDVDNKNSKGITKFEAAQQGKTGPGPITSPLHPSEDDTDGEASSLPRPDRDSWIRAAAALTENRDLRARIATLEKMLIEQTEKPAGPVNGKPREGAASHVRQDAAGTDADGQPPAAPAPGGQNGLRPIPQGLDPEIARSLEKAKATIDQLARKVEQSQTKDPQDQARLESWKRKFNAYIEDLS